MADRTEIEETVAKFGLYIDARYWQGLQQLLTEIIELDYVSLWGGKTEKIPSTQLMDRWKKFVVPLKATQHMITNLHISLKENATAECTADVLATHVRPNNMGDYLWTVGGRYDFQLNREEHGWKIASIKLTTFWTSGNPQILNQP